MTTVADLAPIQVVPIDSITPAPTNPRKISDKAVDIVAKSLKRFGWQQPIVVDTEGVIIVGHTRRLAALSLGLTKVPVTVAANLTEAEVKAYRIGDNRTGDYTSWDFTELTIQLEELSEEFSEELGLADWQAVINEFNEMEDQADDLDMDEEAENYLSGEYSLTVICTSEEAARIVSDTIINMDGVMDVRDKR